MVKMNITEKWTENDAGQSHGGEAGLSQDRSLAPATQFSPLMRELYADAEKFARSRHTVLITGPTGAGKEVVARFIHNSGAHRQEPFVPVNCGGIPENLFESQLFGHEKGAFTGAVERHQGFFSLAGKGTLFLDEIGELPPILQVKLLRVLAGNSFWPIGSPVEIVFEGRIVAATNVDLLECVKVKRFREDLYYRLNVLSLAVPPLDQRPEDIPVLASHFASIQSPSLQLTDDSLRFLTSLKWPGNVRQLRNAIERIAVLSSELTITPEILRKHLFSLPPAKLSPLDRLADSVLNLELDHKIAAIEYALMDRALLRSRGNKTKAAEMLGIHRKRIERVQNGIAVLVKDVGSLLQAADREMRCSNFLTAHGCCEKAERLLKKHPYSQEAAELRLPLLIKQGLCRRVLHGWDEPDVLSIYAKAQAVVPLGEECQGMVAVSFGAWAAALTALDLAGASTIAQSLLAEGKQQHSTIKLASGTIAVANTHFWMGEFRETAESLQQFTASYRFDEFHLAEAGLDLFVLCLMLDCVNAFQLGEVVRSREILGQLLAYSESIGHGFSRAIALQVSGFQRYLVGDLAGMNGYARELLHLTQEKGFMFYEGQALIFHGLWLASSGRYRQGVDLILHGYHDKMARHGARPINSMYGLCLADAHRLNNNWQEALNVLQATLDISRQARELCLASDLYRMRGLILWPLGERGEAETCFRTALTLAGHQEGQIMALRASRCLRRLLAETGRKNEADRMGTFEAGLKLSENDKALLCRDEDQAFTRFLSQGVPS